MVNTILCIGSVEDPRIQEVDKHVKSLDSDARIVFFNPLCGAHFIEITAENTSELGPSCIVVVNGGERIPVKSITSVWYRWKPAVLSADDDLQGLIAKDSALKERKSLPKTVKERLSEFHKGAGLVFAAYD